MNSEIVVVDDTPDSLQLLTKILTGAGYRVRGCIDGEQALQAVTFKLPDLILLDVRMPNMDGYEVCRRLKASEFTRDIPVLFISAGGDSSEMVRGFEAGAVDFISKPFAVAEVLARVKTHIQISDQRKALIESEFRRRQIITSSFDGFLVVDSSGAIVEVNDSLCTMTGWSQEELLTFHVSDIDANENIEESKEHISTIMALGQERFETVHKNRYGKKVPVEVSAQYRDGLVYTFVHDLTNRKEAMRAVEKERSRFEAVFASSPVGLLLLDINSVVVRSNRYMEALVLRDPGDLIGLRAGGAIRCMNSTEHDKGCGYGTACQTCPLRQALNSVLIHGSKVQNLEIPVSLKINESIVTRWLLINAEPIQFDDQPFCIVAVDDITEKKELELHSERLSELLSQTAKLSKIGGWYIDIKTEEVVWTEEVYRIHEMPLSYKPTLSEGIRFYHPDSIPVISHAVQDCIFDGTPFDHELVLVTSTGVERHVRAIGEAIYQGDDVTGVKGVFMDITEQTKLRQEREVSEEKYRVFFDASPTPLWVEDFSPLSGLFESLREQGVADLETYLLQYPERVSEFASKVKVITVNHACLDFYKADSLDSFLGNIASTFTDDSFVAFRQELVKLYNGETSFEVSCRVKTLLGEERFVKVNFFLRESTDLSRVLVATIDRTAEEELLRKHIDRELFYKGILNSLDDEIVVVRPDYSVALTNRAFTNNLSDEDVQKVDDGTFCYSLCNALGESGCDSTCTLNIGLTNPKSLMVTRVTEQKGTQVLDKVISPLYSQEGEKTGLVISLRDITERELERSRISTLAKVVEQVPASIVITDLSGTIEYVNPAFTAASGYTFEDAVGQNPRILNSGTQTPELYKELWETIISGGTWKGTFVNKRKDGTFYTEDVVTSPIVDKNGHVIKFIAVKTDITEQLNLAEQLHRSQKMESLGRLAGGVAHDFNNILTAINGYAEFMKYDLPKDSTYQEDAQGILDAVNMATSLTRQLLLFSRNQIAKPQVIVVGELVEHLSKLLHRLVTEAITFTIAITDRTSAIFIDPGQFEQLVMNLIVNAVDAINMYPEAETRTIQLVVERNDFGKVPQLVVRVTDSGCGMSAEVQQKIFDPFFTTKEVGK